MEDDPPPPYHLSRTPTPTLPQQLTFGDPKFLEEEEDVNKRLALRDQVLELVGSIGKSDDTAAFYALYKHLERHFHGTPDCIIDVPWVEYPCTLLIEAAKRNNAKIAQLLVEYLGADVNAQVRILGGKTALFYACYSGNLEVVEVLMRNGARTDLQDAAGDKCFTHTDPSMDPKRKAAMSCLLFGDIRGDSPEMVERALELCLDPLADPGLLQAILVRYPAIANDILSPTDTEETTLLYAACSASNRPAVRVLLKYGADPNIENRDGSVPLHAACYRGDLDTIDMLLGNPYGPKANPDKKNLFGDNCIAKFSPHLGADEIEDIKSRFGLPVWVLFRCAASGSDLGRLYNHLREFPFAVTKKFVNPPEVPVPTSLVEWAVLNSCPPSISLLLSSGANADSVIGKACEIGNEGIVNLLLKYIADYSVLERLPLNSYKPSISKILKELLFEMKIQAMSPLQAADYVLEQDEDLTPLKKYVLANPLLIDNLYQLDIKAPPQTFLFKASRLGRTEAVQFLLQQNANTEVSCEQNTPFLVAVHFGHVMIVDLLIKAGCFVPPDGYSILPGVPIEDMKVINSLIVQEKEKIAKQKQIQILKDYLATLPLRTLPSHFTEATNYWKNVITHSLPQTQDSLKNVLVGLMTALVRDTLSIFWKSKKENNNPISSALFKEASFAIKNKADVNLEQFYLVPLPSLIPVDIEGPLPETANSLLSYVAPNFFNSSVNAFGGLLNRVPALQQRYEQVIEKTEDLSPTQRAFDLYEALKLMCLEHITIAFRSPNTFMCLGRSYIIKHCLKELEESFTESLLLYPRHPLIKVCDVDPLKTVTNVVNCMQYTVSVEDYLRRLNLSDFPKAFVEDVKKITNSNISSTQKLIQADNLFVHQLKNITENAVNLFLKQEMLKVSKMDAEELETATSREFFDTCVDQLVNTALDEYKDPLTVLTFDNKLLPALPFQQRVYEKELLNLNTLQSFLNNKMSPPKGCYTGNDTTYQNNMKKILMETTTTPLTLLVLVSKFLRDVHLHLNWCKIPAYAKVEEIVDSFQNNDVVLIESGTGSGKSTLLPQFLVHYNKNNVIVTQPRREPTNSVGKFVQDQFGKSRVGFQVGGSVNPNPNARLQYFTDALFIGRVFVDPPPPNSIIIIDEVHERTSVMDGLLLVLLEIRRKNKLNWKIGLASATVDPVWFKTVCRHPRFNVTFCHITLPVVSPFKVQDVAPPSGYLPWPNPTTNPPKRPNIAAKDAFLITKQDGKAKLLVFLPNITEILAAETAFNALAGGNISCSSIHASASGVQMKLKQSRVIFANNIAETSLTIPNLSHVLDFNLSVVARVDPIIDNKELEVLLSTYSSQKQRRGRLGRTLPGTYISYYHPQSKLNTTQRCGFELLLNDHLMQLEMRLRYYLDCSLFAGQQNTIGPGIPMRYITEGTVVPVTSLIPTTPQKIKIAATLNLTASMAQSLSYALKNNTCPLAIVWLTAILESREPPTPHGVPLPLQFAKGLGVSGDYGLLLEVFRTYQLEKSQKPNNFDVDNWCKQNGNISSLFIKIIEERIGIVMELLKNVLNINTASFSPPSSWTVNQLEEALLAGMWRRALKRVDHTLAPDVIGPYRRIDGTQLNKVKLSSSSMWIQSPAGSMPKYMVYNSLDSNDGRSWANYIMGVQKANLKKFTRKMKITQSIGIYHWQQTLLDPWLQANPHIVSSSNLKTRNQQPQNVFSAALLKRNEKYTYYLNNIVCELVFTGNPVDVASRMDKVVKELNNLIAQQNVLQQAPNFNNIFGKVAPSISIKTISSIDPAIAKRLTDAVCPRPTQNLIGSLQSGSKQAQGLALCNILINEFHCSPKGGIVRDIIIRGMNQFEDIDLNLWPSLSQQNWRNEIQQMCNTFKTKYQYTVTFISSRPGANGVQNGMIVLKSLSNIEFEMVSPWNTPFFLPTCMDMSVNNLLLKPNSQDLHSIVPIGISCDNIIRQLMTTPPQASPLYNIKWVKGSGSKSGEGVSKTMWVEADAPNSHDMTIMDSRLKKMRGKKYWLVEASHFSQGNTLVLYHGTSQAAMKSILSSQTFKPGSSGNLGPGVYMSRDMNICKLFGNYFLSSTVDPGKVETVKGFVGTQWYSTGADTAFLPSASSPRNLEEWCIRVPSKAKITNIKQHF